MEQQIIARIAELEAERDGILTEANKQLFAIGVAINELRKLLPTPAEAPPIEESATREALVPQDEG